MTLLGPAQITAILTGAAALVTAITALVRQFRHQNGPAHKNGP